MNTRTYVCPRDDYPLVPVFAMEGRRRRIIALSCPEPYCDHMQLVPKDRAREIERFFRYEQVLPLESASALTIDAGGPLPDEGRHDDGPTRLVR